jgi:hypothetical protein
MLHNLRTHLQKVSRVEVRFSMFSRRLEIYKPLLTAALSQTYWKNFWFFPKPLQAGAATSQQEMEGNQCQEREEPAADTKFAAG